MIDNFPKRKSLRLQYFDYNTPGAYFVTMCTHNKLNTLSIIRIRRESSPPSSLPYSEELNLGFTVSELTGFGCIVDKTITNMKNSFSPGVTVDRYVIMPNHVHLILIIPNNVIPAETDERAIRESPLQPDSAVHKRSAISKAVGYIKMNSCKKIHELYGNITVWQRGFHDHVIRNNKEYEKIAKYISDNPMKWEEDCFFMNG